MNEIDAIRERYKSWQDACEHSPETIYQDVKTLLAIIDTHDLVRPAWQWPAWLKAAAVAMDKSGLWYAHLEIPEIDEHCGDWSCRHKQSLSRWLQFDSFIDFTPPPCTDWRDSLMVNPDYKQSADAS